MKRFFNIPVLLFCGMLGVLGILLAPRCKAETTPLTFPLDCKPYHLRSMKYLMKAFSKCSRELKANSTTDKEYEENMGCAMKCVMRITGYAEQDIVTIDTITKTISKMLPAILAEPVKQTLITNCHEKFGDKLNPKEPQCRSYSEYAFCIQNCIADMVESEYCIKEEKKSQR